jgi:tRNA threonylcarbamoyladenosine biosynthesis protein TsaE
MKSKIYITKSAGQTRKIGEKLAREILLASQNNRVLSKEKSMSPTTTLNSGEWWGRGFFTQRKGAIVIAMQGDLGGGKTTFIQGLARGLGIKENITSPTFVILKKFEIVASRSNAPRNNRNRTFYHIDAYRLEKPEDLTDLGIEGILLDTNNTVVIEWSEKIQKILPKNAIKIKFEFIDEKTRKIVINNHS